MAENSGIILRIAQRNEQRVVKIINLFSKTKIPKEFFPDSITVYLAIGIFILLVIIQSISLMSSGVFTGGEGAAMKIGWPANFIYVSLSSSTNTDENPMKLGGLLLDFFVYLLIGYLINLALNFSGKWLSEMIKKRTISEIKINKVESSPNKIFVGRPSPSNNRQAVPSKIMPKLVTPIPSDNVTVKK